MPRDGRRPEAGPDELPAARCGRTRPLDGRYRRTLATHRRRVAEAPDRRPGQQPRPAEHRRRVHGNDRTADGEPGPARAGADRALAGLHVALAEHRAPHDGHGQPPGDRGRPQGPAVPRRCLEGKRGLRFHQAVLFIVRPLRAGRGYPCRRARRTHGAEGRFLRAAVRGRDEPEQLPAHQPRGAAQDRRERRGEPAPRPEQPARRSGAGQGPAADQDDRHQRVQHRREHRGLSRQGRVPERPHATHPVRADHREGAEASAARSSRPGSTSSTSSTCGRRTAWCAGRRRRAIRCSW